MELDILTTINGIMEFVHPYKWSYITFIEGFICWKISIPRYFLLGGFVFVACASDFVGRKNTATTAKMFRFVLAINESVVTLGFQTPKREEGTTPKFYPKNLVSRYLEDYVISSTSGSWTKGNNKLYKSWTLGKCVISYNIWKTKDR